MIQWIEKVLTLMEESDVSDLATNKMDERIWWAMEENESLHFYFLHSNPSKEHSHWAWQMPNVRKIWHFRPKGA